ncbi:hypothetical protein ACFU3O_14730 [Streptomyces antibioticus]|uniref:hypothetical protein n=1 Tax=Streptomyces antibioticus TaxID=1890 RepID=UPI0036CC534C
MRASIGDRPEHYERLGLAPDRIQPWENGLRTGAADGTWEWWYCDAHLDDGSTLTVEFHTKPPYVSPASPLTPFVLLTLTLADGTRIDKAATLEPEAFRASAERCDVTIGINTFKGGPADGFAVHVEIEDVVADIRLTPEVGPWRPATGHVFFGADEEHYIAWLPVAARNAARVELTRDGHTVHLDGLGYHDHNWGNIAPRKVLDHWYWGRACMGDHTVVTLNFVAGEMYDNARVPALLVARSGEQLISAVGAGDVVSAEDDVMTHAHTAVPFAKRLRYQAVDASGRYTVTFGHRSDAFTLDFGRAGAYHRFLGEVAVEHTRDGHTDRVEGRTLWELLYFGSRPAAGGSEERMPLIGHQA